MPSLPHLARRNWLVATLLIFACAALLLPGLGSTTASRQQELRVLLTARDMAEGGDWIVPHFMGQERLRKPPLMYWFVASAFKTVGNTEDLFAARSVTAVAATALVLATFFFGRRLVGKRGALLGSLVLATSVGFLYHARLAETDIAQSLFCSLTIFMIYAALTSRSRNIRDWILAGVCSGVGFMIKGPASVAMPAAAAATFAIVQWKQRRGANTATIIRGALIAIILCAVIAAPWYVAVALKTAKTDAQASDEIARLLTESHHKGPIIYYLYTLPARMGVWGLALPFAVFFAWKKLRHHRGPRFVLGWLASTFVILSALSSKQNHYAILLLTPSALLIGWLLAHAARNIPVFGKQRAENFQSLETNVSRFPARFSRAYLFVICALLLIAGLGALGLWLLAKPIHWPIALAVAGVVFIIGAITAFRHFATQSNPLTPLLALTAAISIGGGYYASRLEQILEGDAAIPALISANRAAINDAPQLYASGAHRAPVDWYAHRSINFADSPTAETIAGLGTGDVFIASQRGKSLKLEGIATEPAARRTQMDVDAVLFVGGPSKR